MLECIAEERAQLAACVTVRSTGQAHLEAQLAMEQDATFGPCPMAAHHLADTTFIMHGANHGLLEIQRLAQLMLQRVDAQHSVAGPCLQRTLPRARSQHTRT